MQNVKGILLILFLYVSIACVAAAYFTPANFLPNVLLATLVGLSAMLTFVLGSWALGFLKMARARAAARPKPVAPSRNSAPVQQEDETGLKALLLEAAARLKASPRFAGSTSDGLLMFSGTPLYLVVGFEGSGKTSVILNSGLELELLAGQGRMEKSSPLPTGLANIWLNGDGALIIEIGGRYFGGDLRQWEQVLQVLAAKPQVPLWKRLWKAEPRGFELRGIVHCCDLRFFISKPGPDQIERQSQLTQERLRLALKILAQKSPVYTVFTKTDQVSYFKDFFGRLSEQESRQILGTTFAIRESELNSDQSIYANAETKRLLKAFHALYTSLTERWLSILFYEPVFAKKSKIYEFPREFYRIRQSVADFLVQTFRPSPLEATPVNRGFYFTGTRDVAADPPVLDPSTTGIETTRAPLHSLDATQFFHVSDLQRMGATDAELNLTRVRRGGFQPQAVFLTSLFQNVISRDRCTQGFSPTRTVGLDRSRSLALGCALAVSALLAALLMFSWIQNRSLINRLDRASQTSATVAPDQQALPTLSQLTALDELRQSVQELAGHNREGAPLSMRMGLYAGSGLNQDARRKYFRQLQASLLDRTSAKLATFLRSLPPPNEAGAPRYATVADPLKTFLMMSSDQCKPDVPLVSRELDRALQESGLPAADPRFQIAANQLHFYAQELEFEKPVLINPDANATNHALNYLRGASGVDRYYQAARAELDRQAGEPASLAAIVPGYNQVLTGPGQVSAVFTNTGWENLRSLLESGKVTPPQDTCISAVLGGNTPEEAPSAENSQRVIENLYARDYLEAWRSYLAQFSVTRYSGPQDAAQKLQALSEFRSPLLGLMKFVARNTYFPREDPGSGDTGIASTVRSIVERINPTAKEEDAPPPDADFTLGGVSKAFEPVHLVVGPDAENWNAEETVMAYTEALAKLGAAMSAIARAPRANTDPGLAAAATAAHEAALESVRQITNRFNPESVGGVDGIVTRLLEQPIRNTDPYVPKAPDPESVITGLVRGLCRDIGPVLTRYPFTRGGSDLSLAEFTRWFAPMNGQFERQVSGMQQFIIREANTWKQNPAGGADIAPAVFDFLDKAQQITNTFFPTGSATPRMFYVLRPQLDANSQQVIQLRIDSGDTVEFSRTSRLQRQFGWPASSETIQGALGRTGTRTGTQAFTTPFSSQTGPWAVFRMFGDAEARPVGQKVVEWKNVRGPSGNFEAIEPSVQLEVVEFPNGMDVFNPAYFSNFRCPTTVTR